MDILSKPYIKYGNQKAKKDLPLYTSLNELYEFGIEKCIEVKEYHYLEVGISGENSKLYFDVFDTYNDYCIKTDANAKQYIEDDSIILYAPYANENSINNVLVPGFYLFKIIIGNKKYYSVMEIVPKELNKNDWKILLEDLEKQLKGITQSLMNKNNISLVYSKNDLNLILDKIDYCNQNYSIIISTLIKIKNNPKFILDKNYSWKEKGKINKFDKKTFKENSKYTNMNGLVYSFTKLQNVDNFDNIILKSMLMIIRDNLIDIKKEVNKIMTKFQQNDFYFINELEKKSISIKTLKSYQIIINNYLAILDDITKAYWYKEIPLRKLTNISRFFLINRNYRIIYKLYSELNKVEREYKLSVNYRNVWKRSDELYELWCLFRLLNIFGDLGFNYKLDLDVSNIFDLSSYDETLIQLTRDNEVINVHFNTKIKSNSKHTNLNHPLFTSDKKNKPDIRLDFLIDNIYVKSIPIDVKYRRLTGLIEKKSEVFNQLKAYRDVPHSLLHLQETKEIFRKYHAIIPEVWVFYPGRNHSSHISSIEKMKNEEKMLFFKLNPGGSNLELKKTLIKELKEMHQLVGR